MTESHFTSHQTDFVRSDPPPSPPASGRFSSMTNMVFGSLSIALGIGVVGIAVFAALFQVSPLPQNVFNSDELSAALLAIVCGLCFVGCGMAIFRRATLLTAALLVAALLCGFLSSVVA